jgi:hypothetical protein
MGSHPSLQERPPRIQPDSPACQVSQGGKIYHLSTGLWFKAGNNGKVPKGEDVFQMKLVHQADHLKTPKCYCHGMGTGKPFRKVSGIFSVPFVL